MKSLSVAWLVLDPMSSVIKVLVNVGILLNVFNYVLLNIFIMKIAQEGAGLGYLTPFTPSKLNTSYHKAFYSVHYILDQNYFY